MKYLIGVVLTAGGLLGACTRMQRAPALSAPPMTSREGQNMAPQRNLLEEAGDATWNVVTAPTRLIAPKKNLPREAETYEPPAAVITQRVLTDQPPAAPSSQPAH